MDRAVHEMRITMKRSWIAMALVGAALGLGACAAGDTTDDGDGAIDGGDGKSDGSYHVKWDGKIEFIMPKNVHNYLEKYQWGDYHIVFHMTRKWFVLGDSGRNWLKRVSEASADVQEGDPGNGIEFLTMHRAMIEHLRDRWGTEPVTNSEDGRTDVNGVLDGWKTDDDVIAHLEKVGGDVDAFKKDIAYLNDFSHFASEDDFGLYLQTALRLTGEVDPNDTAKRFYDRDMTVGAGVHNWLHGQFQDDASPINVGDPQVNLSNQRFWGIHGWIEQKWKQFENYHHRTPMEMAAYTDDMQRFELHMQLHSDYSTTHHATNRPSRALAKAVAPILFSNDPDCADVADGAVVAGCQ